MINNKIYFTRHRKVNFGPFTSKWRTQQEEKEEEKNQIRQRPILQKIDRSIDKTEIQYLILDNKSNL
uniref:Uncharacterized protein n=1 Tax=Romanomermis culicivorax TaxID=13658 RepID=A0A915JZ45_ROMCU